LARAVLVASILIQRNAQRRKNETARATLNNDTYSQIIQVLNDARAGKYDSAGAAIARSIKSSRIISSEFRVMTRRRSGLQRTCGTTPRTGSNTTGR
jgi:hypothetical protein